MTPKEEAELKRRRLRAVEDAEKTISDAKDALDKSEEFRRQSKQYLSEINEEIKKVFKEKKGE